MIPPYCVSLDMFYTPESRTHFPQDGEHLTTFICIEQPHFLDNFSQYYTYFYSWLPLFNIHVLSVFIYSIVYRFIKTICWYFFKPFPPNLRFVISICTQYILYILVLLSSEIFTIKCNLQKRCKKLFFSTSKYIKLPYGKMKTQTQTENDFLLNFFIQCS